VLEFKFSLKHRHITLNAVMVLIGKLSIIEKDDITNMKLIGYVEGFILDFCTEKSVVKVSSCSRSYFMNSCLVECTLGITISLL